MPIVAAVLRIIQCFELSRRSSLYGGRVDTAGTPPILPQEGNRPNIEEAHSSNGHFLDEAGQYHSPSI